MGTVKHSLTFSYITRVKFVVDETTGLKTYGTPETIKIQGKVTRKEAAENHTGEFETFLNVQHLKETVEVPADEFYKLAVQTQMEFDGENNVETL